jgi:hypothetical protein
VVESGRNGAPSMEEGPTESHQGMVCLCFRRKVYREDTPKDGGPRSLKMGGRNKEVGFVISGRTDKQGEHAARYWGCGRRLAFGGDPGGGSGKHPVVGVCASRHGPALWGWFARTAVSACVCEGTGQDLYSIPSTDGFARWAQPAMTLTRRGDPFGCLPCRTLAPSRNPAAAWRAPEVTRAGIVNRRGRFVSTICEHCQGRLRSVQSRRFAATATCDFHSHNAADAFRSNALACRWVDRSRTTDDP